MEETNKEALNAPAEDVNSSSESPAEESQASPEVESEAPKTEEATSEESTEQPTESGVKKRSAQGRIKELVKEKKSLQENIKRLTERRQYEPEPFGGYPQQPGNQIGLQPGQELSMEDYQSHVAKTADNIVRIRLAQQENLNRINREAGESMEEYEILNPKSSSFDPELSDAVTETVTELLKANPTASVKNIVGRLMKPYGKTVTKVQAAAVESANKQVNESATRPTTSPPPKAEKKLSWQEIEKQVGIIN